MSPCKREGLINRMELAYKEILTGPVNQAVNYVKAILEFLLLLFYSHCLVALFSFTSRHCLEATIAAKW